MKTAIITDSSCDLPKGLMAENDIFFAPLRITYKDREYADIVDISAEEVVANLKREVPKTSLPKPESLQNILDTVVEQGYERVVGIFMSSGLSGTYNMARQLFDAEDRLEKKIYDTKTLSLELGFIVLEMAKQIKAGAAWDKLDALFESIRERTFGIFTINTLEYLKIGGRIGRVEGAIGDLLKIKPLVAPSRDEGVYYTVKKCRGRRRALDALVSIIENYSSKKIKVGLVHCDSLDEVMQLKQKIEERFSFAKVTMIGPVSPALGVHGGPGLIGLICQEIV